MKKFFTIIFCVVALCIGLIKSVMAVECEKNEIIFATGDPKGTYSLMFKTIEEMVPDLVCEYTDTTGGFVNVNLLLERKIDAGLVQSDVIDYMKRTDQRVQKKLRSLGALHGNMIHIIMNRNGFKKKKETGMGSWIGSSETVMVSNLRDLKRLPIAAFGSGFITARVINERLRLEINENDIIEVEKKEEGLELVKNGKVAAMIAMGGIPISWVEKLDRNIFALANVDLADIAALGNPYYASKMNYRTLGVMNANAITVRNEIIVWDYAGPTGQRLEELRSFLKNNLEAIKEERGSHPAWQDVDSIEDISWLRYGGPAIAKKK